MSSPLRFLVLTEDSGKQAQQTVQRLLKCALKALEPTLDTRRLEMSPLPENDEAVRAASANRWKEKNLKIEVTRLVCHIASRLLEPGGFVLFHVDSDTAWSSRSASENRLKFSRDLRSRVKQVLTGHAPNPIARRDRPQPRLTEAQAEAALFRLLPMHPCYAIEAWLYQSVSDVRRLCSSRHHSAEHVTTFESWEADRTQLDEVIRPKDLLGDCVADRHNAELAASFPDAAVHAAQRSWFEFVQALRTCEPLQSALRPDTAPQ